MAERTPQDQDKFVLRLPEGMRDRIKAAAEANNRSMNAEIVSVLEELYPAEGETRSPKGIQIIRVADLNTIIRSVVEIAREDWEKRQDDK